ncbi:unnamed protein product [Tenebrio molitor]|nr:unnamed protein product [Tenebrio molitor]
MTNKNYKIKFAQTRNQITMQLSQAGTDKNPLQNRIPVNTRLRYTIGGLEAGGDKLSVARGLRRII